MAEATPDRNSIRDWCRAYHARQQLGARVSDGRCACGLTGDRAASSEACRMLDALPPDDGSALSVREATHLDVVLRADAVLATRQAVVSLWRAGYRTPWRWPAAGLH